MNRHIVFIIVLTILNVIPIIMDTKYLLKNHEMVSHLKWRVIFLAIWILFVVGFAIFYLI